MKKYIVSFTVSLMLAVILSFSVYAVETSEENSVPVTESSVVQESSPPEPSVQQSSEESSSEPSITESSQESSYESSYESSAESSIESSQTESSAEESSEPFEEETSIPEETSVEESSEEPPYEVSVTDPFEAINNIDIILPVNKPDYNKPNIESSVESSEEPFQESSETVAANTSEISDTESTILNTPPVPQDEVSSVQLYNSTTVSSDNTSFLLGIIFWSVIGLVVTTVLIIVLHSKGGGNQMSGRNRYRKNVQKPNKKKLLSEKYYK